MDRYDNQIAETLFGASTAGRSPGADDGRPERENMKIREIIDKGNGKRWDIYKKDENNYFYKYYEFFKSCGWRLLGQDGGHKQGFYWSKEGIEYEFDIKVI